MLMAMSLCAGCRLAIMEGFNWCFVGWNVEAVRDGSITSQM